MYEPELAGPITQTNTPLTDTGRTAKDWALIAAGFRDADNGRATRELVITLTAFVTFWGLAVWAYTVSPWLAVLMCVPVGGFLVRLFTIQHDCGHGSFFSNKIWNDRVGRCLGVLTATPYHVWKSAHARHHMTSGNLDKRGIGDVYTMTVSEYRAAPWYGRAAYRVFRNPLVLFVVGPAFVFLLQNRLPVEFMKGGWKYWISALGTNLAIACVLTGLSLVFGAAAVLTVSILGVVAGATAGVWLFYMQHQFEDTHWARAPEWQVHHAALDGSSHYDLPAPLHWISGNIGLHHIHHLNSRIPSYRLPEMMATHPELADINRLTIGQSLTCANLHLWDEASQKLVSFKKARQHA